MTITVFSLLIGSSIFFLHLRRSPLDVLCDLEEEQEQKPSNTNPLMYRQQQRRELIAAGITDRTQQKRFLQKQRLLPLIGAISLPSLLLLISPSTVQLLSTVVIGFAVGYLISRYRLQRQRKSYERKIQFYLPIVMERLVMAVQSGQDIFGSLHTIVTVQDKSNDPVTKLLAQVIKLSESGMSFEQALRTVSERVFSPPLRHAFIHLAVAQQEGGELVYPLRELSDATQLYYQESIEHEIAELPVKATVPLLVTFVGLILIFITAPVLQVLELTSKAGPQ